MINHIDKLLVSEVSWYITLLNDQEFFKVFVHGLTKPTCN